MPLDSTDEPVRVRNRKTVEEVKRQFSPEQIALLETVYELEFANIVFKKLVEDKVYHQIVSELKTRLRNLEVLDAPEEAPKPQEIQMPSVFSTPLQQEAYKLIVIQGKGIEEAKACLLKNHKDIQAIYASIGLALAAVPK